MIRAYSQRTQRALLVERVRGEDKPTLALYPQAFPSETVWLRPNDVAELAEKLAEWAHKHGGKSYPRVETLPVSGEL